MLLAIPDINPPPDWDGAGGCAAACGAGAVLRGGAAGRLPKLLLGPDERPDDDLLPI